MTNYTVRIGAGEGPASTVLRVAGEVDLTVASELLETILCAAVVGDAGEVHLDLSDVTFLDSSGVAALVRAQRRLEGRGVAVRVVGSSPAVYHVLALTGLDGRFGLTDSDLEPGAEGGGWTSFASGTTGP